MFYYTNKRRRNKKIILIAGVVAIAIALTVLIIVFSDTIAGWFSSDPETSSAPTGTPAAGTATPEPTPQKPLDEMGLTVSDRFGVPDGFQRVSVEKGSFGEFLRNYPLKPYGTVPKHYDGSDHENAPTVGVLNQILLHQNQTSPDAIMFLYAQYLFEQGAYDRIAFNFNTTPPFSFDYATWLTGQRVDVTEYPKWYTPEGAEPAEATVETLQRYMKYTFAFANTTSLSKQLSVHNMRNLQVGDILVFLSNQGNHSILVLDVCRNSETGELRFICAEGRDPATEMYLLQDAETQSVWLTLEEDGTFVYDDKVYGADCVRRFE